MAKHSFLVALTTALLALLPCTIAVDIPDIFTVQSGNVDGSCDARMGVLDDWLTECSYSLDAALNAIDEYNQDKNVRQAMSEIFSVSANGRLGSTGARRNAVKKIRDNIEYVARFFNNDATAGYNKDRFWLFCDSTFLDEKAPTDTAFDFKGDEIKDKNGNPVAIKDVPVYQKKLAEDRANKPWWTGRDTALKGYYFDELGGNYCSNPKNLAATAATQRVEVDANGKPVNKGEVASVILCPSAFDNTKQPNSYRDANALITAGTSLAAAVPKSATLLHEVFHAVRGTDMLSGKEEEYDLGASLKLLQAKQLRNIENYVFFIAHMYHMRGDPDGTFPWSIDKKWNFEMMTDANGNDVFGAVKP